jgi:hypothetical protein
MPFLFWMPMIVMCGLWRAAEEDAKALFPRRIETKPRHMPGFRFPPRLLHREPGSADRRAVLLDLFWDVGL